MIEIAKARSIECEASVVWAALADLGSISRWAPDVDHSWVMSPQRDGVGAMRRIQSGRLTVIERIVDWTPERGLAYRIEGLPPFARSVENRWHLEPTGAATLVTLTTRIDPGPALPRRAIGRAVGRRLGGISERLLDGLATHLTTGSIPR